MDIAERIAGVREQIGDTTLVCVTKGCSHERINEAITAGIAHIGENRINEFNEKSAHVKPCTRHLIGHLQRNKVKWAVELFDIIQSVDRLVLARQIDKRMSERGKKMPVLVQVNIGKESTKYGIMPEEVPDMMSSLYSMDYLDVRGLMCIPPFDGAPRPHFKKMKRLFDQLRESYELDRLSMGMSGDYRTAVEEGATMVRVGSAIFRE